MPQSSRRSFRPDVAARAGIALRTFARRVTDGPMPAEAVLMDLSMGFTVTRMMAAVARTGVADELMSGPKDAQQIAAARDLDANSVHRVLRALSMFGVVRIDSKGTFRLTRVGRLLAMDDPNSMADWLLYLDEDSTQQAWARISETMRDGQPSFPATHGRSVWDYFAEHPAERTQFASAMRRLTTLFAPAIVKAFPWPRTGVVCDVAGGFGTLLAVVMQDQPGLTGILIDHRDVLAGAEPYLREAGVLDRVERVAGDIFSGFTAKADIYLLKDVLHDWDDESCVQILRMVRTAAQPGATVVLVEMLQPKNAAVFPTSVADVHMLTQCDGGTQRSLGELHALLRSAGFRPGPKYHTIGSALITGEAI